MRDKRKKVTPTSSPESESDIVRKKPIMGVTLEEIKGLLDNCIGKSEEKVLGKIDNLQSEVFIKFESRITKLEKESRCKNVVIFGLPEKINEQWSDRERVVSDFGKKLGLENLDYDVCFRLGKIFPGKNRPLLLKLLRQRDKQAIMSNVLKLKGTRITIKDDLTPEERMCEGLLRIHALDYKKEHPNCKFKIRNSILTITDGEVTKKFTVDNGVVAAKERPNSMETE